MRPANSAGAAVTSAGKLKKSTQMPPSASVVFWSARNAVFPFLRRMPSSLRRAPARGIITCPVVSRARMKCLLTISFLTGVAMLLSGRPMCPLIWPIISQFPKCAVMQMCALSSKKTRALSSTSTYFSSRSAGLWANQKVSISVRTIVTNEVFRICFFSCAVLLFPNATSRFASPIRRLRESNQ